MRASSVDAHLFSMMDHRLPHRLLIFSYCWVSGEVCIWRKVNLGRVITCPASVGLPEDDTKKNVVSPSFSLPASADTDPRRNPIAHHGPYHHHQNW